MSTEPTNNQPAALREELRERIESGRDGLLSDAEVELALASFDLTLVQRARLEAIRTYRATPSLFARRLVDRWEWRVMHREMRKVRRRAVRLLDRAAAAGEFMTDSSGLARLLLTVVLVDDSHAVFRDQPHMLMTYVRGRAQPVYALHLPASWFQAEPDTYELYQGGPIRLADDTRRWALAALALYVLRKNEEWWRSSLRNCLGAWREYRNFLAGETMLAQWIGQWIDESYDRACTAEELLEHHRDNVRRRARVRARRHIAPTARVAA